MKRHTNINEIMNNPLSPPKVSIILPVYNVEQYLYHSLSCLVNQTLRDIEIICVDDGSTDQSVSIIQSFADRDSRVQLILNEHSFAGGARNAGLDRASGDYVMFLDPDDYYDVTMLEKLYDHIVNSQADMAVCGIYNVYEGQMKYAAPSYKPFINQFFTNKIFNAKDVRNDIWMLLVYPYNKIYKRSFLTENGIRFQPIKNTNDASFAFECMIAASKILMLNEAYYYYRHSRPNNTRTTKGKNLECVIQAYEHAYERCKRYPYFKDCEAGFKAIILSSLVWHLNIYCKEYDAAKSAFYDYIKNYALNEFAPNPDVQLELKNYHLAYYYAVKSILQYDYKTYCKKQHRKGIFRKRVQGSSINYSFLGIKYYSYKYSPDIKVHKILGIPVFSTRISRNKKRKFVCGLRISKETVTPHRVETYLNYVINKLDLQKSSVVYLLFVHLGETFLLSNMLKLLVQNDKVEKIHFVVRTKTQQQIIEMFAPKECIASITHIPIMGKMREDVEQYIGSVRKYKDVLFRMLMPTKFWTTLGERHFYGMIQQELNLPQTEITPQVDISEIDVENALKKAHENHLNLDRYIYLSPEAMTVAPLPMNFWEILADKLRGMGYDLYLNITKASNYISGTKCFDLNIKECYILAQRAKYIISLRSGLIDVLAYTKSPAIVLYDTIGRFNRNTLKKIPWFASNPLWEYVYTEEADCIETIVKTIENDNNHMT